MNYAGLQGASLFGARLHGASLYQAQVQGASLDQAQLQGASLDQARLQGASLESARLQGASLVQTQLQGASLKHARLTSASPRPGRSRPPPRASDRGRDRVLEPRPGSGSIRRSSVRTGGWRLEGDQALKRAVDIFNELLQGLGEGKRTKSPACNDSAMDAPTHLIAHGLLELPELNGGVGCRGIP